MCEEEDEFDSGFGILVVDQLGAEDTELVTLSRNSNIFSPVKDDRTQCNEIWYRDSAASLHVAYTYAAFPISYRFSQCC